MQPYKKHSNSNYTSSIDSVEMAYQIKLAEELSEKEAAEASQNSNSAWQTHNLSTQQPRHVDYSSNHYNNIANDSDDIVEMARQIKLAEELDEKEKQHLASGSGWATHVVHDMPQAYQTQYYLPKSNFQPHTTTHHGGGSSSSAVVTYPNPSRQVQQYQANSNQQMQMQMQAHDIATSEQVSKINPYAKQEIIISGKPYLGPMPEQTSLSIRDLHKYDTFVTLYNQHELRKQLLQKYQITTFADRDITYVYDKLGTQFESTASFSLIIAKGASTHNLKLDDKTKNQAASAGSAAYSLLYSVIGTTKEVAIGARTALRIIGTVLYTIEKYRCEQNSENINDLLGPFKAGDVRDNIRDTMTCYITRLFQDDLQNPMVRKQILSEYRTLAVKGQKMAQSSVSKLKSKLSSKSSSSMQLDFYNPQNSKEEIREAGKLLVETIILAMLSQAGAMFKNDKPKLEAQYRKYTGESSVNDMQLSQTSMLLALTEITENIKSKIKSL